MDSFLLIISIILAVILFKWLASKYSGNNGVSLFLIFFGISMGTLPLIFLKEEILTNSVLNNIICAVSVIYFAILASRIGKKKTE